MKTAAWFLTVLLGVSASASGATWYVDAAHQTLPADGTSWPLAFPSITQAINAAGAGDEIWVAGGTYFEAIVLKPGLSLYGGFLGPHLGLPGEKSVAERNPAVNETAIDGSRTRNGFPAFHAHVVTENNNTILDGFTIMGGGGASAGGGEGEGEGEGELPVIVTQPQSQTFDLGSPVLLSVEATGPGSLTYQWEKEGSALPGATQTMFTIVSAACADQGNYTCVVSNYAGSTESNPAVLAVSTGCDNDGAGMLNLNLVGVAVANCKFTGNTASRYGAAMYNENSTVTITNCVFTGNVALQGGAIYSRNGTITLAGCNFMVNYAKANGGAVAFVSDATPIMQTINACAFSRNEAATYGGAMYLNNASLVINNGVFRKNSSSIGPAIANQNVGTIVMLWNSTFLDNLPGMGTVIYDEFSPYVLMNCIMWDRDAAEEVNAAGSLTASYSDIRVQSPGPFPGTGNINEDPQFVRQFFSMTKPGGDLSLASTSPCLNTGTSNGGPDVDILGVPRPAGAPVDMGAHQHPATLLSLNLPVLPPPLPPMPVLLLNALEYTISGTISPAPTLKSLIVITGGDEILGGRPWEPLFQQLLANESNFSITVPLRQPGPDGIPAVNMLTVGILEPGGTISSPVYCTLITGNQFPAPTKGGDFSKAKQLTGLQLDTAVPSIVPDLNDTNGITALFKCNATYSDSSTADVTGYVAWDAHQGNTNDDRINHAGGAYALDPPSGTVSTTITASLGGLQDSHPYSFPYAWSKQRGDIKGSSHAVLSYVFNKCVGPCLAGPPTYVCYKSPYDPALVSPGNTLANCGAGNYSKVLLDGQYTLSAINSSFLEVNPRPTFSNAGKPLSVNFALWPKDPLNPGVSTATKVSKGVKSSGDPLQKGVGDRAPDVHLWVQTAPAKYVGSAVGRNSYMKDVTIRVTDPNGHEEEPVRILNKLSPSLTFESYGLEPFLVAPRPNGFYRAAIPLNVGMSTTPYRATVTATNADGKSTTQTIWVHYTDQPQPPFQFTGVTGGGWHAEGSALVLEVTVQGATGVLTYQWSKDGVNIPDATDASYSIASPTVADSGTYRCTAMDESKATISTDIVVVIAAADSVPVDGLTGLGALLTALLGGGAIMVRRGVRSRSS